MNPTPAHDGDDGSGDELRGRLRATDPAASLPPATPERVARLLEDTMSEDPTTGTAGAPTGESRETGPHRRSPLTWMVAAAALVVIAGGGAFALLQGDDPTPAGPGAPADPPVAAEASVTDLDAPGAAAYDARCMVPNAQTLSGQPVAFDGTVAEIAGGLVTLEPTTWYAGEETDLVTVDVPAEQLELLLTSVSFEQGGRYLVAADGQDDVLVCGFSAAWSPELETIYVEAFGT